MDDGARQVGDREHVALALDVRGAGDDAATDRVRRGVAAGDRAG
jgi:hypothetical protein